MKLKYLTVILLIASIFISCNEDEWLTEKPLDILSPENSFESPGDYYSSLARIYQLYRVRLHAGNHITATYYYPSDIAIDFHGIEHGLNSYENNLVPENWEVSYRWNVWYRIIFDCNVILDRIDETDVFTDESERLVVKAEARFLRGFAFKQLVSWYGGVPIILTETSAPKRDFVRASAAETWEQVISDYTFASQHLPPQSQVRDDGRVTKGAADHALAEAYLHMGEWDNAIASATAVINSPDYALMTERFGTWADRDGDVYSDLFRRGNVNYHGQAGTNTEAIWVSQYHHLVPGGGAGNNMGRFLGAFYWALTGNDGEPLFFDHSQQHGGRGIGWLVPTEYMLHYVWEDEPDDMRNSEHNILRDVRADNPNSAYYGEYIVESGAFTEFNNTLNRWWHAIWKKTVPIDDYPEDVIADPETGRTTNSANLTYNSNYIFRLAETYLLRAEAHLGKGDLPQAAADINVVRARAGVSPVAPGDVDIDYLLDERARELHWEEMRVMTLMRLGLLQERVDQYNIMSAGHILPRNSLWPIPQSEIERNTEAEIIQNPGYE